MSHTAAPTPAATLPQPATLGGEGGRRRRPSGEAPPLPRQISRSSAVLVAGLAATVALWLGFAVDVVFDAVTRADLLVVEAVAALRTDPLTTLMRGVHALGSLWTVRVLAWAVLIVLVAVRRFHHLFLYLALVVVVTSLDVTVADMVGRMRPLGVEILGVWDGYAHPSRPVAGLGLAIVGVLYTLVPPGRWRDLGKFSTALPLGLLGFARVYLGVDHPTDVLAALAVGVALPVVAFRLFAPAEVFPVSYHRGTRAHLDVGGRRGEAIATALRQQLGLDVVSVEPFALHGSAGSTPLRLCVRDDDGQERRLFGKLYALTHLRSDRWYKLARTVLYGRLEDERPFNSVRRLVEYEDHMLRLMRDAGLPTARPYGFVEITPEREYLIVTEFFEGAVEIGAAEVDDGVIDDALRVVRGLWDAGMAHRDIKPANLLVRDGEVLLIDPAFGAVRPSPWRQAVDLADMMLVLALRSTPERVYERALLQFSPDDVAEAFAATRSVTIPSELRARLRADGRDLPERFRRLAPPRQPVAIQLWTMRRVVLALGLLLGGLVGVALLVANLNSAGLL